MTVLEKIKKRLIRPKAEAQPPPKTPEQTFRELISGNNPRAREAEVEYRKKTAVEVARARAKEKSTQPVETIRMSLEERQERARRRRLAMLGGKKP